jgi:hypothetical protein
LHNIGDLVAEWRDGREDEIRIGIITRMALENGVKLHLIKWINGDESEWVPTDLVCQMKEFLVNASTELENEQS